MKNILSFCIGVLIGVGTCFAIDANRDVTCFNNSDFDDIDSIEYALAREIDEWMISKGEEMDADAYDLANLKVVEDYAIEHFDCEYYKWRQTESKWAWEFDVMIARYAY